MSDTSADAHPEAGAIQGGEEASDASGMSMDDATSSAYDDWDRATSGIAEGERENLGKHLKYHADSAGTTVIAGLNALIEPAVTLRHGTMDQKRAVLGHIVDNYDVRDVPMAQQATAPEYGPPATGADGQAIVSAEEGLATVQAFVAANPIAADELIQDHMINIVDDMRRQGYQPDLGRALEIAIQHHPRYGEAARQEQQEQQVAKAKAASVQVSGSGSTAPRQTSDDVAGILDELVPHW